MINIFCTCQCNTAFFLLFNLRQLQNVQNICWLAAPAFHGHVVSGEASAGDNGILNDINQLTDGLKHSC